MRIILLIILFSIILLYIPLNRQVSKYSFKIRLDDHIPFLPWTVWIYYLYYLLFLASIALAWNTPYAIPLLITQIIGTATASLIWRVIPNGVIRPNVEPAESLSQKLLRSHFRFDRDCNGLPSGHVLHSFIACFYLSEQFPQIWVGFFFLALLISISTLTTKQHYYLDLICTMILTLVIIELTSAYIIRS